MRGRHRYKEDYVIKEEITKDGKCSKETIVYQGDLYELLLSAEQKKKAVVCMFFGILLLIAVFAGMGSLNNKGSRVIYIMIPYVCLFLSFYYELMGCFTLGRAKQKMTKLDYDKSLLRLKKSSLAGIILGIMILLGELLTVCSQGFKFINQKELLFIGGVIFISVGNLFIQKLIEKLIKLVKITK